MRGFQEYILMQPTPIPRSTNLSRLYWYLPIY